MSTETYLIKVAENATALQIQGILKAVLETGGRIEIVTERTIIASLDSNYSELVKKIKGVAFAGGINFRGRKIPRIIKKISAEK